MLNFFYRSVAKSEMNLLAIKNRIDIYLKKGNERNKNYRYYYLFDISAYDS